jgi:hypothetical protein
LRRAQSVQTYDTISTLPVGKRFLVGSPLGLYNFQRFRFARNRTTTPEEWKMISSPNRMAALFVDRTCTEHWIVRDPDGNFWIVPSVENAWDSRQPFQPTEETDLEAIPGHYRSMLGLPF